MWGGFCHSGHPPRRRCLKEPRVPTRVGALGMGEGTPGAGSPHSLSDKPSHTVRSDPLIPVSHSLSIQGCTFSCGDSFLLLGETLSHLWTGLPSGLVTLPTALPLGRHRATQNADGLGGDVHGSVRAAFAHRWAEFIPPADEAGSAQHPRQSPSPFTGSPCSFSTPVLFPESS